MRTVHTALLLILLVLLVTSTAWAQNDQAAGEMLIAEDFEEGMDNWWVEGSDRVWVEDGRLHVQADPPADSDEPHVATVWCKTPIEGNVRIEFDARVIRSRPNVPHINVFMFCSDPDGTPLYETRATRADGAFVKYHQLNGNIITYYHRHDDDTRPPRHAQIGTLCIRRCPGFSLLGETRNYHVRPGQTYHVEIVRRDDFIEFHVDGNYLLGVRAPAPWDEGLIALRTFRTYLWWDNITVTAID
ncbi:MAG: DUF1961 family protein [Armatimonadota bacterium]